MGGLIMKTKIEIYQKKIEQLERDRLDAGHDLTEKDVTISELKEALRQINQFSDVGDDFLAVVRMKEIASNALKNIL